MICCNFDMHYSFSMVYGSRQGTAAGDEIGWDFVSRVQHSKLSFTAYCDELSQRYKLFAFYSAGFMSRSTFVSWFFSWAGRMNIDFRAHIDPWCGRCPPVIAGDGTHIGLALRNLHIDPIDKSTTTGEVKPCNHRRYDRRSCVLVIYCFC